MMSVCVKLALNRLFLFVILQKQKRNVFRFMFICNIFFFFWYGKLGKSADDMQNLQAINNNISFDL